MSGALVALTALGAHNRYTTAAPQQTLFKNAYRRHTAFAMADKDNAFSGSVGFGQTVTAEIARDADLIGPISIQFGLPALVSTAETSPGLWCDHVGHAIVEEVSFSVGGHQFDKQTSEWLEIWAQLSTPESKWAGYEYLIGHRTALRGLTTADDEADAATIWVPIPFYFCLSPKNYYPAISTQYHELKLRLKIRAGSELVSWINDTVADPDVVNASAVSPSSGLTATVRTRYVYLTDDERRRFAYSAHEYLITQIQEVASQSVTESTTETVDIHANHLVSALYFVVRSTSAAGYNQWFNFSNNAQVATDVPSSKASFDGRPDSSTASGGNPISTMRISLNSSDMMSEAKPGDYYSKYQTYLHHTRVPTQSPGINVYSFALDAESDTSTGTVNASRVDRIQAVMSIGAFTVGSTGTLLIYARSFNIARHINGLAGIAYSN